MFVHIFVYTSIYVSFSSSYQKTIDCVYEFSTGCLSVDMVPVLFELERHLEGRIAKCDLVIPEQNNDPFIPIGNEKIIILATKMKNNKKKHYISLKNK